MKRQILYVFVLLIIAAVGLNSCKKNTKYLEWQISQLEQMLREAKNDLTALRTENASKEDFKVIEIELLKLSGELAELRKDYENSGTTTSTPIDLTEMEKAIAEIIQKLNTIEATTSVPVNISEIEEHIANLAADLAKLKNTQPEIVNLTSIENRIADLETALKTSVQSDLSEINAAIAKLRTEIINLPLTDQSALDALIARIATLEKSIEKISLPTKGSHEGHEWVDLGLSVMWATCNIGAEMPEDYGYYYAWGETKGCDRDGVGEKNVFNWITYLDSNNGSSSSFKKYNTAGMELEDVDDVAHVKWKGTWRMPTVEEFDALNKKCTTKWTVQNGVSGKKFTSMLNGQSIFLPATGYRSTVLSENGMYGYYWSRSLDNSDISYAAAFIFNSGSEYALSFGRRYSGNPIRPVCIPTKE